MDTYFSRRARLEKMVIHNVKSSVVKPSEDYVGLLRVSFFEKGNYTGPKK